MPGLNAVFIDVGYDKDAFLHYLDLGPQFSSLSKFTKLTRGKKIFGKLEKFTLEPDIDKHGKIGQQLAKGQVLPVQIVKEPISTKGPRLSCELSLAGRYLVLVPFSKAVNVSKKITSNEERKRLLRLIQSIKPENFGVIVRTVAEGAEVADLDVEAAGNRARVQVAARQVRQLARRAHRDDHLGGHQRPPSSMRSIRIGATARINRNPSTVVAAEAKTPVANLFVEMLNRTGLETKTFADSTGQLAL